ncbi:MAG: LLM class flavin-dependent oxidoreductase [Proteobacteria bacterium]|nr:LLM class flavin-dependent oxidoreductase [Pseudomonadota bacterium]HQR05159.1 LLM class flavin-dependent oxidoreductase [Rhodocyclaceae bacterium]
MAYVCIKYECRAPAATTNVSLAEIYDTTLEQIAWVDSLGYPVTINFCEHHGSDDEYLPSPIVLAAAAARITKNVRLQVNAIMPFLDPLRVAEDVAVLDQLSRGRAEVLLLGGYVPSEMTMFGVDPKQRGRLMDEGVVALKAAWTGEPFEYRGRRCQIRPHPFQQPHPPIFMGGTSAPAARRAARAGDAFIGGLTELNEIYVKECAAHGRPARYQGNMPFSILFVSENPDADWERIAPYCLYETNTYARWQASADQGGMFNSALDAATLRSWGTYQTATPEQVIARARSDMAPNDAFILHPLVAGMEKSLSWSGLRLFFEKVAPHVPLNGL